MKVCAQLLCDGLAWFKPIAVYVESWSIRVIKCATRANAHEDLMGTGIIPIEIHTAIGRGQLNMTL